MKKIRIITIVFLLLFFIPLIIPLSSASISYDPSTNTITIIGDATCGNSEANACSFEDIYNADKAGTLTLIDRDGITGVDIDPVNNTYNLRPADEKVMGGAKHDLWVTIENWSGFTDATIRLIGKDEAGNDQTEDIVVTGNGTYYSDELWTELTQTQVVSVNGSGSFDYSVVQGQWGVVWKQGGNQYFVQALIVVKGWFADTDKAITSDRKLFEITDGGNLKFGQIVDEDKKVTARGCFIFLNTDSKTRLLDGYYDLGSIQLFSTTFAAKSGASWYLSNPYYSTNSKMWNCNMLNQFIGFSGNLLKVDMYNTNWAQIGLPGWGPAFNTPYADEVKIANYYHGLLVGAPGTIKNYKIMNEEVRAFKPWSLHDDFFVIDTECNWTFEWVSSSGGKVWRQYTFNLKVVDKNGNSIPNASVKIWDKNNNLVVDETTDANGEIPEQTLTYGYYDQDHGNTPVMQTPHTIRIAKAGYQTYEKKFTLDKKIDWMIALTAPPKITDWYNNHTNDNSTFVHINTSTCIYFNVTTNQPIEKFHWYLNGKFLYNNYDNITICWNNTEETGILKVWGENSNGTTNTVVWYVGENMSMLNESINLLLEEGEMTGLSLLLGILIIVALVFFLLGVLVPNSVLTLMGAVTSFIAMALPIPMMPDYPYFGIALTGVLFLFGIIGLIITFYQWLTSYHERSGYHKWERYFE